MLVHVFGAYFGLAVSFVLRRDHSSDKEGPTYTSDTFAMIGITLALQINRKTTFLNLNFPPFFRNHFLVVVLAQLQFRIGRR
jgi:hypothetical protein